MFLTQRYVPRIGVDDLLSRPLGRGVCGHIEMEYPASFVREDQEDEEDLISHGGHDEEVNGHDVGNVVLQEALPGLRLRLPVTDHVLGDSGLAQNDPDLAQLADNVRCTPEGIGARHAPDEITGFLGNRRLSRLPGARQLRPVLTELPPMPSDDRFGSHNHEGIAPARQSISETSQVMVCLSKKWFTIQSTWIGRSRTDGAVGKWILAVERRVNAFLQLFINVGVRVFGRDSLNRLSGDSTLPNRSKCALRKCSRIRFIMRMGEEDEVRVAVRFAVACSALAVGTALVCLAHDAEYPARDEYIIEIGREAHATSMGFASKDGRGYLGNGCYLQVLDVSDPESILLLGEILLPSPVSDIAMQGDTAYVACVSNGLRIIDVSNPDNLAEIGSLTVTGDTWHLEYSEEYIYLGNSDGLRVIDVSNPGQPVSKGSLPLEVFDLIVCGNHLYLVNFDGLYAVDVTDPIQPTIEDGFEIFFGEDLEAIALDREGSYVYVVSMEGLHVMDVSQPGTLSQVGFWSAPESLRGLGISLWDDRAFLTAEGMLVEFDVSEPVSPHPIGFYPVGENNDVCAWSLVVDAGTAYLSDLETGLAMLNVNDAGAAPLLGLYSVYGWFGQVAWSDHIAAFTDDEFDLDGSLTLVFDTSDPATPVHRGSLRTWGEGGLVRSRMVNGLLYLAFEDRFTVADLTDPANPCELASVPLNQEPDDMCLWGNRVFVVSGSDLIPIDIEDPNHPTVEPVVPLLAWSQKIAVLDDHLVLAGYAGLELRQADAPYAHVASLAAPYGLHVATLVAHSLPQTRAVFVGRGSDEEEEGEIWMVDVTDPSAPQSHGLLPTEAYIAQMGARDNFLYVLLLGGDEGLSVLNITNPWEPFPHAGYPGPFWDNDGMAVLADMILVSDGFFGFTILQNNLLHSGDVPPSVSPNGQTLILTGVCPNPFEQRTCIEFHIPEAEEVALSVFDVTGRQIATLTPGRLLAGDHRVEWNGKNDQGRVVPAGLYWAKLSTRSGSATRPMMRSR